MQCSVPVHASLQAPQLKPSFDRSTHPPAPHAVSPGRHAQAEPVQYSAAAHVVPQLPQFAGSIAVSVHTCVAPDGHSVPPEGQTHAPPTQTSPTWHAIPHMPH
jgi:hypothetical protein